MDGIIRPFQRDRNIRGTSREDLYKTRSFHTEQREPEEKINTTFLSELKEILLEGEKIRETNDSRKNRKIAIKTLGKMKDILRKPRYMNYNPQAFAQNMWTTNKGIVFQDRNPELPQLLYSHESFILVKKIQDQLSQYLLYKDQKYIQSLPNSIHS